MSAEQVAKALARGLSKDSSEILVGWQSHLSSLVRSRFTLAIGVGFAA